MGVKVTKGADGRNNLCVKTRQDREDLVYKFEGFYDRRS